MTDYNVLDLFAGLGGFSQAFEESERWSVTTVEIEAEFDPDIVADVFKLRPSDFTQEFDVVLASPPCTVFSKAGNHDLWDHDDKVPIADKSRDHVALVHHTIGLVQGLSPEYWFLENPNGRMKWVLGEPEAKVSYCQYGRDYMKPTDLWGDHPEMTYRYCGFSANCHTENSSKDGSSAVASMPDSHAERSLVPYELSNAIREACERGLDGDAPVQTTAEEWMDA